MPNNLTVPFGEHATVLCDLGLEGFQSLLHRLQIVAHPDAANPEGRHLSPALLQLVGSSRLTPGWLLDRDRHDGHLDLRRGAVLQIGLGARDLGQGQIAAFLIQVPEAIEAVAAVAHHPASLGDAAQLLGQFQQADLGLDHLTLGGRHDGLRVNRPGRCASPMAPRPGLIPHRFSSVRSGQDFYSYADRRLRSYEEDHLVPLDLGGSPDDPRNLWPEPRQADGWCGADRKDELEAELARQVCAGRVPLAEAQREIATDWIAAYRRYVEGE